MTDLEPRPAPPALPAPAADTDSWTTVVADIARLAQSVAGTEFVPKEMRGKPAVVTAAILAGRELGIPPMTALQHVYIVHGRPGQSAHLMRALVLAAGHEIDYVEATDHRAIIRGRRTGETDWTEAEFTADQAKRARIQLGDYPADKLVARATARLCRRKFADVISGLAYTPEELADRAEPTPGTAPAPGPRRTARRAPTAAPPAGGPPLPNEPGHAPEREGGDPRQVRTADRPAPDATATPEPAPTPPAAPPPAAGSDDAPDTAPSPAQNRLLQALLRDAGATTRDARHDIAARLLGRPVTTGLNRADAATVIDALAALRNSGHPDGLPGALTAQNGPQ